MDIKLQIISIIFSFVFGVFFSILTNVNYRFLFSKSIVLKIIFTIIFVIDSGLLYFFLIKLINNAVVNLYFLLFVILGFLFGFIKLSKYVTIIKTRLKSVKFIKKIIK